MSGIKSLLKSRKFALTCIPVLAIILKEFGYDISEDTMIQLVTTIGVLVAAISAEDVAKKLRD